MVSGNAARGQHYCARDSAVGGTGVSAHCCRRDAWFLTNRLARAIDRTSVLEGQVAESSAEMRDLLERELKVHSRRITIIYGAMVLCTLCALMISGVVVTWFAGAFLAVSVAIPIAVQFIAAMLAFIAALIAFLREVHLATTHRRYGSAIRTTSRTTGSGLDVPPRS